MSEYSQAVDLTLFKIGLPFWRGETRMELGPAREGSACGLGCTTLGVVVVEGVGRAACAAEVLALVLTPTLAPALALALALRAASPAREMRSSILAGCRHWARTHVVAKIGSGLAVV